MDDITDYFFLRPGQLYHYETIKPGSGRNTAFLDNECVSVSNQGDHLMAVYKERIRISAFNGLAEYRVQYNKVILLTAYNLYSNREPDEPKVILQMPEDGNKMEWMYNSTRFVAEVLPEVETKSKVYRDVICVTEEVNARESVKRYYAKGFGLVQEDTYNKDGKRKDKYSYYLTHTEEKTPWNPKVAKVQ